MKGELYGLTNPQKSILLTEEFYKGSNINNICGTAIVEDVLNFDLLKKAINVVIKNNDSFNLKLIIDNNEIKQYLSDTCDVSIDVVELACKADVAKLENELMSHIFDIYNSDLFCFKIFKFPDNTGGFMLNIHHLFADSWTLGFVSKEIVRTYSSLLKGEDILKDEECSYIKYIYNEKEYLYSDKFKKDKEYWEGVFNTIPEQATIPSFKEETANNFSCKANRKVFNIDKVKMDKINEFCKANSISVFNFFMAVYAIYISRVSGIDDFVLGTPILNRTNFKEKHTSGMFINTAPFRVLVNNTLDFKSFVANIAKDSLGMLRHQKYYYQNILEDLRKRDSSLPNLYNILISYQVTKANTEDGLTYNTRWAFNGNTADDIDIHLSDLNVSGELCVAYDYKSSKYDAADIEDIHNRIMHIIWQILEKEDIYLKDIEIVTSKEKYDILYKFNNYNATYPYDATLVSLFEEQVEKTPDNVAVVFRDTFLTYKELNEKANQLAHYLISSGIKKDTVVALRMPKSLEMIVGILAIIKTGACYLPINLGYPEERVKYMVSDSGAKVLLFLNISDDMPFDIPKINISLDNTNIYTGDTSNCNIDISPEDSLYIIYTSGSTGKPKGALLCHRNVVRLLKNDSFQFDFNKNDVWTMFHSVAFDFSVWEMYGALLYGAKLILVPEDVAQDPVEFLGLLRKENVTILNQTPTYFYNLLSKELENTEADLKVRYIIYGGEALKPCLIKPWKDKYPFTKLINMYGITETTVHVTFKELSNEDLLLSKSNIGVPIPTLKILLLDKNLKLVPYDIPGEICVVGDGVFKGYLNRPDLNSTKLIKNPYDPNEILYRSGDSAILHKDGSFEYCKRIDTQIKIRGFRVELGEIEEKILNFKNITSCVVAKKTDEFNHDILCAYYVKNGPVDINSLKLTLKKDLASYMIPQYFIDLPSLPYNHNGKINRDALPLPAICDEEKEIIAPRNDVDVALVDTLKTILHVNTISIDDSFLELGGDSLSAINFCTILVNKFGINLTVKDILTRPIIRELSDFIATLPSTNEDNKIIPVSMNIDYYPLSSAQKRIYYANKQLGKDSLTYNITGGLLINKVLDKDQLISAAKKLINRHSIFKMSYIFKDNDIVQYVNNDVNIDIPLFYDNFSNLDNILNSYQKPFDLEKDFLLRLYIYYLDNDKTLLLIDTHHIAVDGVSLNIFINELCRLYNDENLEDLRIDYKDFAVWENDFLNSDKIKELENYWISKFKDSTLPSINLPYDYVKSNTSNGTGNRVNYKMDKALFEGYEKFAKNLNVSNYTLFLSVLLVLLYKYTNQEELIVGSTTVGRENSDVYNLIGTFVNNIVIDAKMRNNQAFKDFVKYIHSQVVDDLAHQAYPYDLLVKKLSNLNGSYKNSLFDVSFTYQNANKESYTIDNTNIQVLDIYSNTAKFNLLLEIRPKDFVFSFEYNANLFKEETIKNLLEHYLFVLSQVYKDDCVLIDDIDIITEKEYALLEKFNSTSDTINEDTFVSIFETEVKNNPDNIALICDDKTLTYNELNKKANSLAHYLIKNGIGANDIVCIMTNRSFETIVCMLGILKAGAAFFNVDPTYPIERTQYYLNDSKTKYVLTQKSLRDKVESIENCIEIDLDNSIYNNNFDNPNVKIGMQDLSYIIYTSGSTGTPKGVMLNQVGLANMVKAMTKVLDYLKEGNRHAIASVTSTPFDIFVYEIVVSLAHGMKVVMANNAEHRNPKLLDALIRKYNVDVMTVTPSLMKINYDNREPDSALALVKNMVFGGEPLPEKFVRDLRALADDITIYNIYGPSEITVLSNVQNLDGEKEITVGPPIMNTEIHILDKNMRRVPIGVVGEIYISGIQVGCGYIGKPDMTAEKFINNPFGEGKIYRSGDIGRWTFDGKVQILGRVDHQIKLRGLRIELGEIENVMQNVPGVSSSVVNKIELDNKEVLCGYYVANNTVTEEIIRKALRENLPNYMVPTYIIRLDKMPYTINRKIDRKALPLPDLHKTIRHNKINISELTSNEEKLLQIWKNILKIDEIDINDNFFDIGGDSISAINMQIEAVKYGLNFEYADIFNFPTIAQLSNKLPSPESDFMKNYDYSQINNLLQKNVIENIDTIRPAIVKNILLIGGTGFLGSHVIDNFLENCPGNIYCLVRPKDNLDVTERLKNILHFYFGDKYDMEFGNRIHIVNGDIIKENLGLTPNEYNELSNNIDAVINCGALVKHFGQKQLFNDINVTGTKNIVEFCLKFSKRLLHISTVSISGNGEKEEVVVETPENINDKKIFRETDLYIGQNIKGIYTTTKYKAELIVLEAILNGLDAQILRIGNITNRYCDGVFQINVENNAFAKRIKSFVEIGAIPKYLLEHAIELTPVDLCANAIIKLLLNKSECNVFHLYNPKLLDINLLFKTLIELDYSILPVSNKMMSDIITGILQDDSRKEILSGIIHDLDTDKNLTYTSRIRLNCDFSSQYLLELGFNWKELDSLYIKKYMNYFKKIGFIH